MQVEKLYAKDSTPVGAAFIREAPVNSAYLEGEDQVLVLKVRDGSGFPLFYHITGPEKGQTRPMKETTYIPVEAKVVALCP